MIDWEGHEGAARVVGITIGAVIIVAVAIGAFLFIPERYLPGMHINYSEGAIASTTTDVASSTPPAHIATHVPTPSAVKAIYMTACIGATPTLREKVLKTIEGTEINSVVLDIKDYSGTISYEQSKVDGPVGTGCRMNDLPAFLDELHSKNLYVIGRITTFQDPLYAKAHPEIAVASYSHPSKPWTDKNGLAYIDPDFPIYWDHIVAIAEEAHSIGYDEINFDYIRFPSDGDMSDAKFAVPASTTRASVITDFFSYLHSQLAPQGIVMSADLFGQTTVNTDDLGIGQVLENALPYFDYVAPMDYPSHFIKNFDGYPNPAEYPYEVIKYTMTTAVERAVDASSTADKLRPWIQDFDLGADYTPAMVGKETQAVYDSGLSGWMLWNASNVYDKSAL